MSSLDHCSIEETARQICGNSFCNKGPVLHIISCICIPSQISQLHDHCHLISPYSARRKFVFPRHTRHAHSHVIDIELAILLIIFVVCTPIFDWCLGRITFTITFPQEHLNRYLLLYKSHWNHLRDFFLSLYQTSRRIVRATLKQAQSANNNLIHIPNVIHRKIPRN